MSDPQTPPQSPALPDRLSSNETSPFYNAVLLESGIGIRFNGVEKTNVYEYCVSEKWVRVVVGNTRDRKGNPLTMKLNGVVQPFHKPATPS